MHGGQGLPALVQPARLLPSLGAVDKLASMRRTLREREGMSPSAAQPIAAASFVVAVDGCDAEQVHPGSRGSAIVIGPHHLLTCWHVAQRRESAPWERPDKLDDEPWARLVLANIPSTSSLECVGYDPTLDIALLYSPSELKAPIAQWLDASSVRDWLKRHSPWVALGYPETTRQLSRHSGTGWLGENHDYLQLQGGIPAGFSGGALMPEHGELCAGLIQLGGRKSPISVALSIEAIERFLSRFQGRDAVNLNRVPGHGAPLGSQGRSVREKSKGRIRVASGVALMVLGALAAAWGVWGTRANEKSNPPAPPHVEQTATHITQETTGDDSPIINNNTGTVNMTIAPTGNTSSK
jgi:hypothetical protein